jgi:hypothetical protein
VDRLLGEHGIAKDTAEGRREFERRMERRRAEEGNPEQWKGMRRGWCVGNPPFKQALLQRLHGSLGPDHAGQIRRQAGQVRAEAIIAAKLRELGWKEAHLSQGAKVDANKLALAARLRRETTLTIQEIADRLHMGSRKNVGPKLHAWKRSNG